MIENNGEVLIDVRKFCRVVRDLEDLELFSEAVKAIGPGYVCVTATNGDEGLALAAPLEPCFVFLDINMPMMDGKTVLKRLRLNRALDSREGLYPVHIDHSYRNLKCTGRWVLSIVYKTKQLL